MSSVTVLAASTATVALIGALIAALSVAVVCTVVMRGRAIARLRAAALRLDPTSPDPVEPGIGPQVTRLERAVDAALRKGGEEAETGRRLADAIDVIPQGIVIADRTGEIVFRNSVGEQFSAARHGDALVAAVITQLLDEARQGEPGHDTLELFGPPSRVITVTTFPLAGEDGAPGALAVIDDITERRRLEQVRRDFVANISHELKTPIGALSLLAETIVAEEDEAVRTRMAERLLVESDRVSRTIDDLLSLSRIEGDEGQARERVAVDDVIAEAVARTTPAAEQRGVAIKVVTPPERVVMVGDRAQLVSALYNLLENAVKFSEDGSEVEVHGQLDDRWVELSVSDHGVGIPTADLERIFERFYRVDRARSRETGGTGLGLAIVRHVMVNHDGEASVTSAEGDGSTFTLRVPATLEGAGSLTPLAEATP